MRVEAKKKESCQYLVAQPAVHLKRIGGSEGEKLIGPQFGRPGLERGEKSA